MLTSGCPVSVELKLPGSCTDRDDAVLADGDTTLDADGCNTCTCQGGEMVCTDLACDPCKDDDVPPCADMPVDDLGCYSEAVCGPDGWQCVESCPCPTVAMPECPAPPLDGCYYEGPYCDGQQWNCGALVCPTCDDEILCDPPADPLCYIEPYCNDQLVWECQEVCEPTCDEPPPECLGVTFASCDQGTWVCEGNEFCGPEGIDCPPSPYPYCTTYMECGQSGWVCQETCDPFYCPDEMPACEPMGPANCSPYPTCSSMGWICAETCS